MAILEALASSPNAHCRNDLYVWLLTILHDHRRNPFRQANPSTSEAEVGTLLSLSDLDRALGQLPEEQRAAILLVGLEGMSYAETAVILRIAVGAVRSRIARGRENLCRALGTIDASHWEQAA